MHLRAPSTIVFLCTLGAFAALAPGASADPETKPLFMTMRVPVGGGVGRLDQIAYDAAGQRAFIASPSTNTVQVVGLSARSITSSNPAKPLTNVPQPFGMLWAPSLSRLFVGCGADGTVRVYNAAGDGLSEGGVIAFAGEAEDLAMDPSGKRVWVSYARSVGSFDPTTLTKGDKPVRLNGHAEALAVDSKAAGQGGRLYAAIARPVKAEGSDAAATPKPCIAVIDRDKAELAATWELEGAAGNYALALDEIGGRLFVGCRQPAVVVVLDTATGKQVKTLPCGGDTDGVAWDAATGRLFITSGADGGKVHIYKRTTGDDYALENTVSTLAGAATCTLIPDQRLLLVVVPQVGPEPGALFHYEIRN